jgi:hypothetical protein
VKFLRISARGLGIVMLNERVTVGEMMVRSIRLCSRGQSAWN